MNSSHLTYKVIFKNRCGQQNSICIILKQSILWTVALVYCRWECKLVQPLRKTAQSFLKESSDSTPRYISGKNKYTNFKRYTHPNVHQSIQFSCSVLSNSLLPHGLQHARLSCPSAHQAFLSITNSQSLLKLMFIESLMSSNHPILYHPLLLLPSICHIIRVFSNESVLHIRWPKYWSFRLSISPSNEYLGLISFRMDWLDLLAV